MTLFKHYNECCRAKQIMEWRQNDILVSAHLWVLQFRLRGQGHKVIRGSGDRDDRRTTPPDVTCISIDRKPCSAVMVIHYDSDCCIINCTGVRLVRSRCSQILMCQCLSIWS